jgi:transcriptional regulator with XRE-family HTH domain
MTPSKAVRKRETIGRRIAAARALKGLSQTQAAELAGFTQPYLSLLENDKAPAPSLHAVSKLADVLEISLDYLVKGSAA